MKDFEAFLESSIEDLRMSRAESKELRLAIGELNPSHAQKNQIRSKLFKLAANAVELDSQLVMNWLQEGIRILESVNQPDRNREFTEVAFSPGTQCLSKLQQAINNAQRSIDVCVYTITDNPLSDCLRDAHKSGIKVRIISDEAKADDKGADLHRLKRAGLNIALDGPQALMHHKFAIFDRRTIATGSYNWTRTAANENHENIIFSTSERMISSFQQEFNKLWRLYGKS